ncbi:MAG: undecaprenyl-diphosphate phosphatase [Eubacterium sp.]
MSIITAVFQAIGQAIAWIFPISESGHSAIFHDFSGRFTNACSQLTGIIHIGIAIGIFIAFFRLFSNLFKNFFSSVGDIFHKKLQIKEISSAKEFMYMTILSFAVLIFYIIPAGKYGNVYMLLHRTSYNGTVLGEGICMALTGALLVVASNFVNNSKIKLPGFLKALILGVVAFLAVPTGGCSLVAGVFCFALIMGMSSKYALRYSMVMSVPVLIVMGIIELCTGVTKISIVSAIMGLIISVLIAFFTVKLFIHLIENKKLRYFAIYDIAIGLLCFVIGIFEIVTK